MTNFEELSSMYDVNLDIFKKLLHDLEKRSSEYEVILDIALTTFFLPSDKWYSIAYCIFLKGRRTSKMSRTALLEELLN